jgi:hypothetical protein
MLAVYAGLLLLIAVVIGVAALSWLTSRSDDRLAVISNFLALGTLLLALVAGIVALAAYSAATGLPDLKVKVLMAERIPNEIWFPTPSDPNWKVAGITGDSWKTTASIIVENTSIYAARIPAVIVEFRGAGIRPQNYASSGTWTPTTRIGDYILAVQWDGGPNYSIHGKSSRHLPDLSLQGIRPYESFSADETPPQIIIRLLADGYKREVALPVKFDSKAGAAPHKPAPEWL